MLQPSTITFLRQLKRHNQKAWFDINKEKYLDAKADFENLVQQIIVEYGKIDPDIAALQVKDCVFRIYKDVRFSKDKTPYKTHFAAGINKGGKKVHFPGYYFHAEPGGYTYCGGGIWRPDAAELKKIRQEIDYNLEDFKSIIKDKRFLRLLGDLDDADTLVRAPQGYEEDNPAIKYLKMRSFITGVSFTDEELTSKELLKKIIHTFTVMKPFIDFLSTALE
ncbi:MAG: DUF2461 domain-containing protein [Chitinophagaceae bacterium]|nr:MAG: DUF2461 domain-containing protein [Chitinophagaceae bacterium]